MLEDSLKYIESHLRGLLDDTIEAQKELVSKFESIKGSL